MPSCESASVESEMFYLNDVPFGPEPVCSELPLEAPEATDVT
jgi:hypothetical protein